MGDAYFNSFFRQVARDARQDLELSKWISRSTIGEKIWRWPCTTLNCSWTSRWAKWTRWSISSSLLPWETVWISKLKLKNRKSLPQLCSSILFFCPVPMHSVDDFEYIWSRVKSRKKIRAIKEEFDADAGAKMTVEGVLMKIQQELEESKMKGISLLEKVVSTIQLLDGSTGLPLDVLVSDYVEMLKDRAKSPGDSSRIETLDEPVYLMNSPKDVAVLQVFNDKRPLSSTGNRLNNWRFAGQHPFCV